jgi:hypothetical protein
MLVEFTEGTTIPGHAMVHSLALRLGLSVLLFAAGSCSSSPSGDPVPASPPDFRLSVGEGGGFSGLWTGFTLTVGDSVFQWTGRLPGENRVYAGRLSSDSLRALWRDVDASGLLDSASADVQANLVHVLVLRAGGRERTISWGEVPGLNDASASAYTIARRARAMFATSVKR